MTLWIGREYGNAPNKFLVQPRTTLTGALEASKWKGVLRVSLMGTSVYELSGSPPCSELTTLLLNEKSLRKISSGFFKFMHALKVLNLSQNANINEFPSEICELISLQYMNLSNTSLRILEHLNDFRITVKNVSTFSKLSSFPNVLSSMTDLRVVDIKNIVSSYISSFLYYMKQLRILHFTYCNDLEDSDCALEGKEMQIYNPHNSQSRRYYQCFRNLDLVRIYSCKRLKNVAWLVFAPNIRILQIMHCDQIEEVLCGGNSENAIISEPFAKLERLKLHHLPQLKSICPNALPFPCLRSIRVLRCPELKKLPLNHNSAKGCGNVIKGSPQWFYKLEWEDEATQNAFIPSFTTRME